MAIIPKVGRKTLKMRLVIAALYVVLIAGGVTMVYPFVLMLSTSVSSGADVHSYAMLPRYIYDQAALFPKYAEDRYAGDIEQINRYYHTDFARIEDITPPDIDIKSKQLRARVEDWSRFVHNLPVGSKQAAFEGYLGSPSKLVDVYRAFCRKRFGGDIRRLNAAYIEENESFQTVTPPFERLKAKGWKPDNSPKMREWIEFKRKLPANFLRPILGNPSYNVESLYRNHLRERFGSVDRVNKAFGTDYASFQEIIPPVYQSDWYYCATHVSGLRKDFLTRNYAAVIDYVLLHGRAVVNTLIFVTAVILIHLVVNPMCAYALSRYNLPYAYKVLLFLLATMAFPAEVAMIPSFLLLKQFHMLNTYWALILPGMANGYAIFLLKGFFDSLPRELYEAGIIDGASETTMFRKITIPMSKPIFAVIALQAFTGAYGAFMYAMLVCQDPKMWTMMVWLYQLQTTAPQYITMAALALAAVPTLLVFVFAQNLIMRGIIIPSYK